jgi:paraquat-inducible protein B
VHDNTHFWNASGVSVNVGPEGFHVELESIQALLSGGVAFETPAKTPAQESPENTPFILYDDKGQADSAGYNENIPVVTYFRSSVSGLVRGSPVEIFGIQIGTVTDVRLVMEPGGQYPRARVAFELQPERVFPEELLGGTASAREIVASLVAQGMRAVMESSNFITGQKDISLQFVPNAGTGSLGREGDSLVMPSQSGGLDNITTSLSDIAIKIDAIPFDKIGANLNTTLASLNAVVSGPEVRNALSKLSETLTDAQHLVHNTDKGMQPLLQRLPEISAELQKAVAHVDDALGENGYGGNSDFQRNMMNLLDQVNDAVRSIRLLADFLDRHPEALIRGRTAQATER